MLKSTPLLFKLVFIFSYANVKACADSPKIDPIKFSLSTNATHVALNQEFEIKITVEYLNISPSVAFVLKGANSFRLRLILPDGFVKSGGDYFDFVEGELTQAHPKTSYTLRGKFTTNGGVKNFQLLRSHKNADNQSIFVAVGRLSFDAQEELLHSTSDSAGRLAADTPVFVPYMTISELRNWTGELSEVIQIIDDSKTGIFKYNPSDVTSIDDGILVICAGAKRFLRQIDGYYDARWVANEEAFFKMVDTTDTRPKRILLSKSISITSNRTIPANIKIDWVPGAMFVISSGSVLKIQSEITEGDQQLFSGGGNVILSNMAIRVKWYGAKGDGVTDDTSILNKLANLISDGKILDFEPNKSYAITSTIVFKNSCQIRGNNARLVPSASQTSEGTAAIYVGRSKSIKNSVTSLSVSKGSNTMTIPDGMTAVPGDLISLGSNDLHVEFVADKASYNYKKGQYVVVERVSGQTVTLSSVFYDSFSVNSIAIYSGFNTLKISGLTIDLSNHLSTTNTFSGIKVIGTNVNISGCKFIGNDYAQIGLSVAGQNISVSGNTFNNFFNKQDTPGTPRKGYGIYSNVNNVLVENNTFYDCKHAFTTGGSRENIVSGVVFRGNTVHELPIRAFNTDQLSDASDYTGSIDAHAGVLGIFEIAANVIYAHGRAFYIRNGMANIYGNSVYQITNPIDILGTDEHQIDYINFHENYVELLDSETSCIWNGYNSVGSQPGVVSNLSINRNIIKNGSIVLLNSIKFSINGISISNNSISNAGSGIKVHTTNTLNVLVRNVTIKENEIILKNGSASSNVGVSLSGGSNNTRTATFDRIIIKNNMVDGVANSGSAFTFQFVNGSFINTYFTGNVCLRGVSGESNRVNNVQFARGVFSNLVISDNEIDTNISFASGSDLTNDYILNNARINGNKAAIMQFIETGTTNKYLFDKVIIANNVLRSFTSSRALQFANSLGSDSWAFSKEVLVTGNDISSTSTTSSITISSASTGHRITIVDNILNSPIDDASATFFGYFRNVVSTGTQIWKGGVSVLRDGRFTKSSVPTTGSWAKGDVIYNSVVSTSGFLGWVCVASGTPGTWKEFGPVGP